jgi:hypothetical protein
MTNITHKTMRGLVRDPIQQALTNAEMALRALALAERSESALCPHPLDVVRAELDNVRRYLSIELQSRT